MLCVLVGTGGGEKEGGKSACFQETSHSWDPLCILKKPQGQSLTLDMNIKHQALLDISPGHVKGPLISHHKPLNFWRTNGCVNVDYASTPYSHSH